MPESVWLAVSLLWDLAKTTRQSKAAAAAGRSCDIHSPAIGPPPLPSDPSAGESGFLLSPICTSLNFRSRQTAAK